MKKDIKSKISRGKLIKQRKISLNINKNVDIIIQKLNKLTLFEKKVLLAACKIKPGRLRTYKWIAQRIGRPRAQRAVGQALKKNPLPLLIPCHRVVASRGKTGGFSLGVDLKKKLICLEKDFFRDSK
ncbi:MAG: MGMT family protein [Candidatus Omnitrophota bacterium]